MSDRRAKIAELLSININPVAPADKRMKDAGETPPSAEPAKEEAKEEMSQADFSGYGKKKSDPAKLAKALRNR